VLAVAERVARHGAGLVLDPESPAGRIEDALRRVLDEPGLADGARRLAAAIARYPEDLVVREIEAVAQRSAPPEIPVRELS
jgi:UDP:flavonoid glycosyltransferase YjiC (YdhE family)